MNVLKPQKQSLVFELWFSKVEKKQKFRRFDVFGQTQSQLRMTNIKNG